MWTQTRWKSQLLLAGLLYLGGLYSIVHLQHASGAVFTFIAFLWLAAVVGGPVYLLPGHAERLFNRERDELVDKIIAAQA